MYRFLFEVLANLLRYTCKRNVLSSSERCIGVTVLYHGMGVSLCMELLDPAANRGLELTVQRGNDMIMLNVSSCYTCLCYFMILWCI
jgi:hypothetical protein